MERVSSMKLTILPVMAAITFVSACSDDRDFIADGPVSPQYSADLAQCKNLAQQRKASTKGTKEGAVVGGLLGAIEGLGDTTEVLAGAAVGTAVGAGTGRVDDLSNLGSERRQIVINCMRGRGHNVLG